MADINPSATGTPREKQAHRPGDHDSGDHDSGDHDKSNDREFGDRIAEPSAAPLDEASIELVEMLFFAYRDFTGEADAVLEAFGFGRAHHRVMHFVNRRPGLRVADLLEILRITKQSLARVLKELVDRGFVEQAAGASDRRERRLYPTHKGRALATRLARLQIDQVGRALHAAGAGSEPTVQAFLTGLIAEGRQGVASGSEDHERERASGSGEAP